MAVILILSGFLAIKNWPAVKYETRKLNISLFQGGQIAGGMTTELPAAYHHQEHSLSCEIASLKMALSVYNINPSESELISKLAFDPTAHAKGEWGDPSQGFVGNIDGKMLIDGYGVYWQPIADVANLYANSQIMQFTPQTLAQQISLGHPVVAWGYSGGGKIYPWKTPDGTTINGVNGEHARTIVGFTGSVNSPTGFEIYDPIYGKLYWKTADLMKNWAPFNDMGVAVLPK